MSLHAILEGTCLILYQPSVDPYHFIQYKNLPFSAMQINNIDSGHKYIVELIEILLGNFGGLYNFKRFSKSLINLFLAIKKKEKGSCC